MTSDIQRCELDCLDFDAFDFPGAANVTTVNIQHNNFLALPETLLWNMTSLQHFDAQYLVKLATLPERFFRASKKSGNVFRVGIFLDFVRLTTRAEGPHGAHVRGAKRNRIDRRSRIILPLLCRPRTNSRRSIWSALST